MYTTQTAGKVEKKECHRETGTGTYLTVKALKYGSLTRVIIYRTCTYSLQSSFGKLQARLRLRQKERYKQWLA